MKRWLSIFAGVGIVLAIAVGEVITAPALAMAAGSETILKAADMTGKIFPDKVFFRGQVATVQMRNTAGLHFADDAYLLVGLVDNSGYSSDIRQKYQAYLITEVPLEVGGQKLAPGAYGMGFLTGGKLVVMDLGAHDVFETASGRDSEMKRPVPLQILPATEAGKYRLYAGRDYVEIGRAQ